MILRNSAICLNCNQEIVSRYRTDYITCSCGRLSVDGGSSYIKRNGNDYVDTSLSSKDDFSKIRDKFEWGTIGINGKQRLQYIKLKDIETAHIQAILETQSLVKEIKNIFKMELDFRKNTQTQEEPIYKTRNAATLLVKIMLAQNDSKDDKQSEEN